MILLADNQITNAEITATNSLSFAGEEKLQVFQLDNKFKASQGTTSILIDFGADVPDVSMVALCGTNISSSATMSLSYSDTTTIENTISLPSFSVFNQVWVLDSSLNKRFWTIDISDSDSQGADTLGVEIGYIYIGEYTNINMVTFPHSPALNIISTPSTSATGQEYGSKSFNQNTIEFTATFSRSEVYNILKIIKDKQNIDPVLIVPFEDDIDDLLYPPRYGVLSADSYAYPMMDNPDLYELSLSHRETF